MAGVTKGKGSGGGGYWTPGRLAGAKPAPGMNQSRGGSVPPGKGGGSTVPPGKVGPGAVPPKRKKKPPKTILM